MRWILLLLLGACSSLPRNPKHQGPLEISVKGFSRKNAKLYLPEAAHKQLPLLVLLHGFTATADVQESYFQLRERVSSRGFALLTPDGTVDSGGRPFWNATDICCDFEKRGVDDVGYLRALIAQVKSQYPIDAKRVYLFGHSNGGFMANRLACEMGEQIAAIVNLAGGSFKKAEDCKRPTPLRYLHIHAENDPRVRYHEHPTYAAGLPTVRQWLTRNGCQGDARELEELNLFYSIPDRDTARQRWNCRSSDVELWRVAAFTARNHNPHVPSLLPQFTDSVLDYLALKAQ